MFTGIIEELGQIAALDPRGQGLRLIISVGVVSRDSQSGDSIAVNGVCLTALDVTSDSFAADVSPETLSRTTLGSLAVGSPVNLERAVTPSTRLGGHIVQGHVDGRGTFLGAEDQGDFRTVGIGFPSEIGRYLVFKGSIAVEGISLTIAALAEDHFEIAVIPKTWEMTNLSTLRPSDAINLEVDMIAKYVERLLAFRTDQIA
ncbi:MAG TPA: riboflavin synthase [Pyrinomonadaceae bacterium]